jgi:serine/threonine protein kinase
MTNVLDLLKLGSDAERLEKLSSLSPDAWMHPTVTKGFKTNEVHTKESFVFVKNLFVDVEDNESRVDILINGKNGEVIVQKEYMIEMSCDLKPDEFIVKVHKELDIVSNLLPAHKSLCPLYGWFRGGWPGGKEDPTRATHFTLLMPLLRSDNVPITPEFIRLWSTSTLDVLVHLHDHNIICANLKYDNILYDATKNKCIMIDWGDLVIDDKQYPYDENGSGIFMAPEQIPRKYDNKVDSFSFGIILIQMCLGHVDLFKYHKTLLRPQRDEFWDRLKTRKEEDKDTFWQKYAKEGLPQFWTPELIDLVHRLTEYNPTTRLACKDALKHPYFANAGK